MEKNIEQKLERVLTGSKFDRRIRIRNFKDRFARYSISFGGISVITAVLLIMFFLVYVVAPLFTSATVKEQGHFALPGSVQDVTLYYGMDEYKESAVRFTQSGKIIGFQLDNGQVTREESLPLNGAHITSFSIVDEPKNILAFGLSNGSFLIAQYGYTVSYPNDVKTVTPEIKYPFGEEPIELADSALSKLALRLNDEALVLAYQTSANPKHIQVKSYSVETSFLDDSLTLSDEDEAIITLQHMVEFVLLDGSMRNLYLVSQSGETLYYDIAAVDTPELIQRVNLVSDTDAISTIRFLLGDYSLMVGTQNGMVYQWFPVRNQDSVFQLQSIRQFEVSESPIVQIAIEHARRGFATIDQSGQFDLFHSTSERHLESIKLKEPLAFVSIMPRADGVLLETVSGTVFNYNVKNEYADVSFKSLWGKVWYEGYEEPDYTWQSSSASSDFEPKLSMMPLTFGTIKAAIYSMLFAVPIAILAAIYTAFFMDAKTRQWIKPSVELIEALPTVILGFLAGLWLAPMMEANLSGFFAVLVVVPVGILLFGFAWSRLPKSIRLLVPEGKRTLLMIPVVFLLGYFAMAMDRPLENAFFNGDMRHWLTYSAGIDFDQRNAMVIGFAMGFALIPTIFSVAEDALYNVPRYLINGSLALGASSWQTMVGVVLPTASPGIFSAIMLGFGRGVGETMIVLMASGNTPLMEVNIFEGMRTLSANLAVEMAEAEVYSSHYRVLFLSGLALFVFTFFFNTLAEVVRERMRRKYSSL